MSSLPRCDPFTEKERASGDATISMAVYRQWFENYESNRPLILKSKGIDGLPIIETAVAVGAGWSLSKNIGLLKDIQVPVITSDKCLKRVLEYTRPLVVCALNTARTDVETWLDIDSEGIYLVAPVTAHPRTFTNWKGPIIFVNPQNTCEELVCLVQKETGLVPSFRGENVGMFTFLTAVSMGAKRVALLGMNYCFEAEEEALNVTRQQHAIKIMDYTGQWVYTVFDWIDSRKSFLEFCDFAKSLGVTVVNCSEGGILWEQGVVDTLKFKLWRRYCV